ncbi:MAG: hypothetical protein KF833_01890 [Verrucomicrobiae bacterium]|nr:hypothetical protein [Verrucomicrobiae bacterium]
MWQPWSKILEALGRFRIPFGPSRAAVTVGQPGATDAQGGSEWMRYRSGEALCDVWGPLPETPWECFHCVPLFASLDALDRVGTDKGARNEPWPTAPEQAAHLELPPHLDTACQGEPLGDDWVRSGVWVILDLAGYPSIALAARLVAAGYQPVCTFNHWPHPQGLIRAENLLAGLLRFAPVISAVRHRLSPASPPVWICDRDRLGQRPARPREFDNRYYLDDASLPGPETLRRAGIRHLVCIVPERSSTPMADLRAYFAGLRKEGFTEIHGAALSDPDLTPFDLRAAPEDETFKDAEYQRSASGGFGRLIPEPSSGGG